MALTLSRRRRVEVKTGHPRSSLYNHITLGLFPPPIKIGPRASAWIDAEVDAVLEARIAGHSDEQIRALVKRLVAARADAAKAFVA